MLLFVDNLTNVDFSYLHPQRGLLGETWLAHITLHGALDAQGMVCDFGIVKKTVRNWLDREIDHRLAVPANSSNLALTHQGEQIALTWQLHTGQQHNGQLHTQSPRDAIALVTAQEITPESVAAWATAELRKHLPDTIDQIELSFTQEAIQGVDYQYSHGLKKHLGNCQRIAHGHRSTLAIWRNDEKSTTLEQQWAEKWRDIYIGTREDLQEETLIAGVPHCVFRYTAQQGDFTLTLPKHQCYLIDTDSTVEFIAQHIAQQLHLAEPTATFKVKAYEGMGKGAIAVAG